MIVKYKIKLHKTVCGKKKIRIVNSSLVYIQWSNSPQAKKNLLSELKCKGVKLFLYGSTNECSKHMLSINKHTQFGLLIPRFRRQ